MAGNRHRRFLGNARADQVADRRPAKVMWKFALAAGRFASRLPRLNEALDWAPAAMKHVGTYHALAGQALVFPPLSFDDVDHLGEEIIGQCAAFVVLRASRFEPDDPELSVHLRPRKWKDLRGNPPASEVGRKYRIILRIASLKNGRAPQQIVRVEFNGRRVGRFALKDDARQRMGSIEFIVPRRRVVHGFNLLQIMARPVH